MIYYKFLNNNDENVIGQYPQTILSKNYDPSLSNSHWNLKRNKFADFNLNYELVLNLRSTPTNFLDGASSPSGLIISEKVKSFLSDFNLPPHKFYRIKVYQKNKLLDYYLLQIINTDIWDYIDEEKSTIKVSNSINDYTISVPVISKEYVKKLNEFYLLDFNYTLSPESIFFKKNYPNFDIISLDNLAEDFFFSLKLKKALENEKLDSGGIFKIIKFLK